MQQSPGRIFPNDAMYCCMRPLRLSLALILLCTPGWLSAQSRLPTGAVAHDPASGRVVYREQRSTQYSDNSMVQSDLVCLSPEGDVLARVNLDLAGEYAELEWTRPNSEHLQLTRAGGRWIARYKSDQRVNTQVTWPRLRVTDLIEDQLLAFLQHVVGALKQRPGSVTVVRAPQLKRQRYALAVAELDADRFEIRLQDQGWFSDNSQDMRITMDADGRLLRYQGPPRCPLVQPDGPLHVDVRYLY